MCGPWRGFPHNCVQVRTSSRGRSRINHIEVQGAEVSSKNDWFPASLASGRINIEDRRDLSRCCRNDERTGDRRRGPKTTYAAANASTIATATAAATVAIAATATVAIAATAATTAAIAAVVAAATAAFAATAATAAAIVRYHGGWWQRYPRDNTHVHRKRATISANGLLGYADDCQPAFSRGIPRQQSTIAPSIAHVSRDAAAGRTTQRWHAR